MESEKTDILAIIAFILAFLMPLVGLILGIVAYSKLSKTKGKGKGFALAAIIISISLLLLFALFFLGVFLFFFSVFDFETFGEDRCFVTPEFVCEEYVISGDEVKISLRNNEGRDMYISSFTLKDSGSVVCSGFVPQTLSAGDNGVFTFSNCNFPSDKTFVSLSFDVKYRLEDSFIETTALGHISSRMI